MSLVRIGELARRAQVPIATIKHYLREGLIKPSRKSGRTMSWYDPALVARIRAIKDLQRRQFLPLDVIKSTLVRSAAAPDDLAAADAIAKVLARHGGPRSRTRDELIERGADPRELDVLAATGLAVPTGPDRRYRGDDLSLLLTLGAAREAGLSPAMLPFSIIHDYLAAIRGLVDIELRLFRSGVLGAAPRDVARLTTAATKLSERLVVLVRRKLLLPTLQHMIERPKPIAAHSVEEPSHDHVPIRARRPHHARRVRRRTRSSSR